MSDYRGTESSERPRVQVRANDSSLSSPDLTSVSRVRPQEEAPQQPEKDKSVSRIRTAGGTLGLQYPREVLNEVRLK